MDKAVFYDRTEELALFNRKYKLYLDLREIMELFDNLNEATVTEDVDWGLYRK